MTINNKSDETREALKMEMTTEDVIAKIANAVNYVTTFADFAQAVKSRLNVALDATVAALRRSEAEERNDPLTEPDLMRMAGCAVWFSVMNAWAEVSYDDGLVLTLIDTGMRIKGLEKFLPTCPIYRRKQSTKIKEV